MPVRCFRYECLCKAKQCLALRWRGMFGNVLVYLLTRAADLVE